LFSDQGRFRHLQRSWNLLVVGLRVHDCCSAVWRWISSLALKSRLGESDWTGKWRFRAGKTVRARARRGDYVLQGG